MKDARIMLPVSLLLILAEQINAEPMAFPYVLPDKKPERPLSAAMKQTDLYLKPETYFSHGLGKQQRDRIEMNNREPKQP